MSEAELKRLIGWIYHRSRKGCFSKNRRERDSALSDINVHAQKFRDFYTPGEGNKDPRSGWSGESP